MLYTEGEKTRRSRVPLGMACARFRRDVEEGGSVASGGSKKQRRLREEEASLSAKRSKAYLKFAAGLGGFVLFLVIRQALVSFQVVDSGNTVLNLLTYALAVVAAGVVGIGALELSRANARLREVRSKLR